MPFNLCKYCKFYEGDYCELKNIRIYTSEDTSQCKEYEAKEDEENN